MSPGSACIFVDGENLRHSLCELFDQEFDPSDYLPKNADWSGLFDHLVMVGMGSTRLRSYWYVVDNIDFYPYGLNRLLKDPVTLIKVLNRDRQIGQQIRSAGTQVQKEAVAIQTAEELIRREKHMKSRFEGWKIFQDGIMSRFDAIEFRRAGSIHFNLFNQTFGQEKAVDVKLATDLLERRSLYDVGIVVSGDQDYVPAVQAAKDSGKQIVNVSFIKRDGRLLPGGARRLNHSTDRTIEMPYAELKQFMRFPTPLLRAHP